MDFCFIGICCYVSLSTSMFTFLVSHGMEAALWGPGWPGPHVVGQMESDSGRGRGELIKGREATLEHPHWDRPHMASMLETALTAR